MLVSCRHYQPQSQNQKPAGGYGSTYMECPHDRLHEEGRINTNHSPCILKQCAGVVLGYHTHSWKENKQLGRMSVLAVTDLAGGCGALTWHVPITDSMGMGPSAPSSSSSPEMSASLDTLPTCVLNTTCTAPQAHTAQQTHFDSPFHWLVVWFDACCLCTHATFTSILE
jgi:hypothetical protein